jgi:DNA mismatch repair ATPase MutS
VHFEDQLEDGHVTFDYVCRPGIMTRSNALALMRAVGLDVGASSGPGCVGGQRA